MRQTYLIYLAASCSSIVGFHFSWLEKDLAPDGFEPIGSESIDLCKTGDVLQAAIFGDIWLIWPCCNSQHIQISGVPNFDP